MGLAAEVLPTGLLVRAAVDLLAELVLQVTGRITDSDFNPGREQGREPFFPLPGLKRAKVEPS